MLEVQRQLEVAYREGYTAAVRFFRTAEEVYLGGLTVDGQYLNLTFYQGGTGIFDVEFNTAEDERFKFEETVEVSTSFMRSAVDLVVPYLARSKTDRSNSFETFDYSRRFLEALLEELLASAPFCDHEVGICACEELRVIAELRLLLSGRRTCTECGGEGFVWRENIVEAWARDYVEAFPEVSLETAKDFAYDEEIGNVRCSACGGGGTVPLPGKEVA